MPTRFERKREEHEIRMRTWLAVFACGLLGVCCLAALSMFFFQGFCSAGFHLPDPILHWIAVVTIGSLGGLTGIVYRGLFPMTTRSP